MRRTYGSSKKVGKKSNGPRTGTATSALLAGLVRDYGERAYQFAYRLSGNADEAKDLVQEALRRVMRNWNRYDQTRPLDAWFFTILRHAFLDGRRRYERRKGVSLDTLLKRGTEDGSYADILPDDGMDILDRLEREETARAVRNLLDTLGPDHRAVLKLRELEGLRYDEIANTLGVGIGTVRSRLARAREAFRVGSRRSSDFAI